MIIEEKTEVKTREAEIIDFYKTTFPEVAAFVRKMGGSLSDAKDVFQDTLVIYYEKKLEQDFLPEQSERAYLKGIAKHLWYKKFKDKQHTIALQGDNYQLPTKDQQIVSEKLLAILELSGKRCLELLSAFYYEHMDMKSLAQSFGFSSERSATVQKFKCLEKVRETIRKRAIRKEDLYE